MALTENQKMIYSFQIFRETSKYVSNTVLQDFN